MEPRKQAICNALAAFIRQRPGLEWCNYATSNHAESVRAYRTEQRSIARDKREAETLLRAVMACDDITADALLAAARDAYSGRLSIIPPMEGRISGERESDKRWRIEYCVGQYMPTEYRKAAAAVCAAALWDWQRANMPPPLAGPGDRMYSGFEPGHKSPTAMPAGTWLRNEFRREFGRSIQQRWFN